MKPAKHDSYLNSRVLTASPHQLHLMLIEAAIRYGNQAVAAVDRGDQSAADAHLLRVIEIVGEMLAGVRDSKSELNRKIAGFYLYLFRIVAQSKINNDMAKLKEALSLLDYERQTWQLVCDKLSDQTADAPQAAENGAQSTRSKMPIAPPIGGRANQNLPFGISLEA